MTLWLGRKLVVIFSQNITDLKIAPGTQQSTLESEIFCRKVRYNIYYEEVHRLHHEMSPLRIELLVLH